MSLRSNRRRPNVGSGVEGVGGGLPFSRVAPIRYLISGVSFRAEEVTALIDAWGKLDDHGRGSAIAAATVAGERAATRVETELRLDGNAAEVTSLPHSIQTLVF